MRIKVGSVFDMPLVIDTELSQTEWHVVPVGTAVDLDLSDLICRSCAVGWRAAKAEALLRLEEVGNYGDEFWEGLEAAIAAVRLLPDEPSGAELVAAAGTAPEPGRNS